MNRLDQFDDVSIEILIGFALAFLFAIGFAPQFFNLPKESTFSTWPFSKELLYISFALFIIKLVHEQSVFKYHLEKHLIKLSESTFKNIILFISRIILLFCLYLLIILVFTQDNNKCKSDYSAWSFGGLLFVAYIVPDWILYRQCLDIRDDKLKINPVWYWIYLDFINFIGIIYFILGMQSMKSASIVSLVILFIIVVFFVLAKFTNYSEIKTSKSEFKKFNYWFYGIFRDWIITGTKSKIKITFMVIALISLVGFVIYGIINASDQFETNYQILAIGVLAINVFDWVFNFKYFFSEI